MWKGAIFEASLSLMCLQISRGLADLGWVRLGLVLSYTLDPAAPCVSPPPWTSGPPKARCHDDTKMKRPRPAVQARFTPPLMSQPLVPCWPKQVSWPSWKLRVGRYTLSSQMVRLNINGVGYVLLPGAWRTESIYLLNRNLKYHLGDVLKRREEIYL